MDTRKLHRLTIFSAVLAVALVMASARADEFDQAIKLTFNQPVSIPGQTLPAGSYWFVRPDNGVGGPQTGLQVMDVDRKNVIATLSTGNVLVVPSGRVTITLADRSPKEPSALLSVVYPGRETGQQLQLVYTDRERRRFDEFPKVTMRVDDKGGMEKVETNGRM